MDKQFTASEVRELIKAIGLAEATAQQVLDQLGAFADLLEAREKAVPVMVVNHVSSAEHDLPIGMKLYTHPAPSDAERLAEALRDLVRDVNEGCDYCECQTWGSTQAGEEVLAAYSAHSAQAQPPAASVTDAMVDAALTRAVIASKESGIKGPTRYMMRAALESALAAQENPNG